MAKEKGISQGKADAVRSIVMAIFACGVRNRADIGSALPDKQEKSFSEFFSSTKQNEILDLRTTVMVQIAAAFVNGCPT